MKTADCHPDRPHEARGLCSACYQRHWKAGTLPEPKKPPSQPHTCQRDHKPSSTCYVGCKCRCDDCRAAIAANERRRTRAKAYGTFQPYVDAEPVRLHVRALMAPKVGSTAGMGWKRIAEVAGVPSGVMTKLLYGDATRGMPPSRRITRANAEKILGVEMLLADGATVQAGPTRRKLNAMIEGGFTKAELGRYITGDVRTRSLQIVPTGRGRTTVATARKVEKLYRDWKAGRIIPRGRTSRWQYGPPSPVPATPGVQTSPVVGIVNERCEHCGNKSLAGGRWCLKHLTSASRQQLSSRAA